MSKPIILCVDDEQVILNSLKTQLKKAFDNTYFYEMAESADEALELLDEFDEDGIPVIIIVSDWLMPGIKGDEFLIQVHQKYPKIVKVMLTGQANEDAIARAKQYANLHQCIAKPWEREELIGAIKSGLQKYL